MTTQQITAKLKIECLKDKVFENKEGKFTYNSKVYALYHPDLGYFAFDNEGPYIPSGGKKALQAILNDGGMTDYDKAVWFKSLN